MTRRVKKTGKKPTEADKKPAITEERAARFTWQPDDIVFVDPKVQKAYEAAANAGDDSAEANEKKPAN